MTIEIKKQVEEIAQQVRGRRHQMRIRRSKNAIADSFDRQRVRCARCVSQDLEENSIANRFDGASVVGVGDPSGLFPHHHAV